MADVLFFILGSVFSLALVMAVLALVPMQSAPAPHPPGHASPNPGDLGAEPSPQTRRDGARRRRVPSQTKAQGGPALLSDASRASFAEREAYRVRSALDHAERALSRIARSGEHQAAKIAEQTLRRIHDATEPPAARLAFAVSRLELLSLRPEPKSRACAASALGAMA